VVSGRDLGALRPAIVLVPVLLGAVGLVDDARGLSPALRFGCQLALGGLAAGVVVGEAGLSPLVGVLAVGAGAVWMGGYINVFNFMDGINGIAATTAGLVGVCYLTIGAALDADVVAVVGAVLTGSSMGFLPFNFPRARVFLGDSGSYFLGSMIAIAVLVALEAGAPLPAVAAPLVLYLADTSVTLLRRVRRGERWWEPHREHVYQRLANGPLGHTATTAIVAAMTGLLGALGLLTIDGGVAATVLVAAVAAIVVPAYLALPALLGHLDRVTT
jgi:UDP-N-acetylmuramyl pentapeptide phosphotransferase/UDP-N-acetylglucosamine-1-phosphate transferase